MKGLIIKDLFSIKREFKMVAIFTLVACVAAANMGYAFGLGFIAFLSGSLSITSFAYDDISNWNRTALSMPLTRAQIVISKYIVNAILVCACTLTVTIIFILCSLFGVWDHSIIEILSSAILTIFSALIFFSILIPFIIKFGSEKARMVLVAVIVIVLAIGFILGNLFSDFALDESLLQNSLIYLMPILSILLFVCSILTSIAIFKRKEI